MLNSLGQVLPAAARRFGDKVALVAGGRTFTFRQLDQLSSTLAAHLVRLGIPDRFIEHGERGELLADLSLDAEGIAERCRQLAARADVKPGDRRRVS